jgi:NADPH2:quinone reductase
MKALLCKQHGEPETLVVEELPPPAIQDDEVLVRVHAAGVNFPDTLIIRNLYQFKPPLPFVPGGELAGVVESVGADVKDVKPGDRVAAVIGWGAFAEYVVVPAAKLIRLPPNLDFETAASMGMTYGTSYHALVDRGALNAGETLLVLGAAGGVGLAAVEIGKALGARVIAAASSAEKLAICREHGADELINYSQEDLKERLKGLTDGKGVDVVYDPVGGPYSEVALRNTAWRGRFLVVGFAHGEIPKLPANLPLLKGCSIVGVFWGEHARREPELNARNFETLLAWQREGKIRPHIAQRFPLERGGEAIRALMSRTVVGKVVINVRA